MWPFQGGGTESEPWEAQGEKGRHGGEHRDGDREAAEGLNWCMSHNEEEGNGMSGRPNCSRCQQARKIPQ
ncbi:hypothetical protein AFE02nite_30240 [Actinotalea fermentans]|uniref:Uncharacterized protein n=1 Tax=Actinotalea fermentans TaxID=43671 RepID=A0A511Z1F3_9CELL|nr:hypothetical protein AFE02nite_30240 [Actinotalea fermentans]